MPAAAVAKSDAQVESERKDALKAEALQRLADAQAEKAQIETDLRNCYFYTAPRRLRQQSSTSNSTTRANDDRQLQTSFGFEVVDDFMNMLIDTFTPREGPWAERKLPTQVDQDGQEDEAVKELNAKIGAEDAKIFGLIRASNYYAEKSKQGVPDAGLGIVALLITDPGKGQTINCLGVPIREIDIDLGPDGRIDFRSITRPTKNRHVKALLGKEVAAKLSDEDQKKIKDQPNEKAQIVWSWWRNWDNAGNVEWQHVVLFNSKHLHDGTSVGEGSCPFVLGRFGATPDFAWPDGPTIKSLSDLVYLDELCGGMIENVDFTLRPPKAYEDDGVLNIPQDGVRPGEFYPKRASGGREAFEDIYEPRPIEAALFDKENLIVRIRRLHYVDFPEQKGKTPPTATQWIDELVIRQKRIGTPGYAFWREEPYETFQRFRYLGEKRGVVKTLVELGVPVGTELQPYNPAERAQDSQEIATAVRFGEIALGMFPNTAQIAIDEFKTLDNLKNKFRDRIVVMRSADEVKQRIALLGKIGADVIGGNSEGGQGGQGPPAQ
jgi:hypothetical protein